jgi:dTMP kinase
MERAAQMLVLEGLDGAGKSTLGTRVARRLGAVLLSTPPAELRSQRGAIDTAYSACGLASQLFYASTVALVSQQAHTLIHAGHDVVIDRYWLSTLAYDTLRPGAVDLRAVEAQLHPADLTVLVEVDEAERRRRIQERGLVTAGDLQSLRASRRLRRAFRDGLRHAVAGRPLVLDVTDLDVEASTDRVCRELRSLRAAA